MWQKRDGDMAAMVVVVIVGVMLSVATDFNQMSCCG